MERGTMLFLGMQNAKRCAKNCYDELGKPDVATKFEFHSWCCI